MLSVQSALIIPELQKHLFQPRTISSVHFGRAVCVFLTLAIMCANQ